MYNWDKDEDYLAEKRNWEAEQELERKERE